jgi:hypothetical protein
VNQRTRLGQILERIGPPSIADIASDKVTVRQGRRRLIALLFLFDAVLIVAVLLSFQGTELVEEERVLLETQQVYVTRYPGGIVTNTTVITKIIPYGSQPPE